MGLVGENDFSDKADLLKKKALQAEQADVENISPYEKDLMTFMDSDCGLRDKWGLRFSRHPNEGLSDTYKSGPRVEKTQFRLDWAKGEFRKVQRIKENAGTYKLIDEECCTYKPFSLEWKGEGGIGNKGALDAATKLATRCIAMGGKWIRVNKLTDRLELLVVEAKTWEVLGRS